MKIQYTFFVFKNFTRFWVNECVALIESLCIIYEHGGVNYNGNYYGYYYYSWRQSKRVGRVCEYNNHTPCCIPIIYTPVYVRIFLWFRDYVVPINCSRSSCIIHVQHYLFEVSLRLDEDKFVWFVWASKCVRLKKGCL